MNWQRVIGDDRCHGIVTRDGDEEPCEKPTVCIIDDPEGPWAACAYHAHRYGTGWMVTLAQIREALSNPPPSRWLGPPASEDFECCASGSCEVCRR